MITDWRIYFGDQIAGIRIDTYTETLPLIGALIFFKVSTGRDDSGSVLQAKLRRRGVMSEVVTTPLCADSGVDSDRAVPADIGPASGTLERPGTTAAPRARNLRG